MSPTSGHSGSLQVFNKQQSTVSDKIGSAQKLDTSIDRNLADDGDSTSILGKVMVVHCSTVPEATSSRAVGWILRVPLSETRHQILWS